MQNKRYTICNTQRRAGFTIVELLLALAITGILLAAAAVAFNASAVNYHQNENMFKTINVARQALFRMTTQLRTADAVAADSPLNECTMITAGGDDITYRYNSAENRLYLITNDDLSDADFLLCNNVTAMSFQKDSVTEDAITYVKNIQISMTVENEGVRQTLSAAAAIRRNLK